MVTPRGWPPFLAVSLIGAMGCVGANAAPASVKAQVPTPISARDAHFRGFLVDFKKEAVTAGILPATYDRAVAGLKLNPRIEELNEKQPEFVRPVWDYLNGIISETRVTRGRALLAANANLFARLQTAYGVPPEILTAIWGIETSFGQDTGSYYMFESLGTLAYEGPRTDYGRREFIAALKIADIEKRDPRTMTGSWAGAFGQTQFIPTTFLALAVDGDGDGKRDVWNSPADALASAANYLNKSGWRAGESWGEEVQLPQGFAYESAETDVLKSVDEWTMLGVRSITGEPLKGGAEQAAIFLPAGYRGPAFLVRNNFNVILRYNNASTYALAVGLLAERFKGGGIVRASWPVDELPLDLSGRTALQEGLTGLGFTTSGVDGVLGRRTRQAIRDYQKARGLTPDGFATAALLTRVLNERSAQR